MIFLKEKLTVLNAIIFLLLLTGIYFTILAFRIERLNLSPLFALIAFVFAFVLIGIRAIIGYLFRNPAHLRIGKIVLLVVAMLLILVLGFFWLELHGYYQ